MHEAVVAGKSEHALRRILDECARGSDERRAAAANFCGVGGDEPPLAAARRVDNAAAVGVLIEAGADVASVFGKDATPLLVCIAYGLEGSARALLSAARASATEPIAYDPEQRAVGRRTTELSAAVHACIVPPKLSLQGAGDSALPPPRLGCLEAVVGAGGSVNVVDSKGRPPLAYVVKASADHEAAVDALLRLGAAPDGPPPTLLPALGAAAPIAPVLYWIEHDDGHGTVPLIPCLRKLVAAGARMSGGVFGRGGYSPLAIAALRGHTEGRATWCKRPTPTCTSATRRTARRR